MDSLKFCSECGDRLGVEWPAHLKRKGRKCCRPCWNVLMRAHNATHPKEAMLSQAKLRAIQKGIEFCITQADFDVPERCPVFGIPLFRGTRRNKDNAPSLDRVDTTKGYIPGNVQVISYRANRRKSDSTIEDLEAILNYMKKGRSNYGHQAPDKR